MKSFKFTIGLAILALAGNAKALNLDLTNWGGPENYYLGSTGWFNDSVVLAGGLGATETTRDAEYLAHGTTELINGSGIYLTFQLRVPVTADQIFLDISDPGNPVATQIDLALRDVGSSGTSAANMFKLGIIVDEISDGSGIDGALDCTEGVCQATGVGYGDGLTAFDGDGSDGLGMFAGAGLGMGTIIAEGSIVFSSANWNIDQQATTLACLDSQEDISVLGAAGCTQVTTQWIGGGTLEIDITEQDDAIVLSNLEGADSVNFFDVTNTSHTFDGPFNGDASPSSAVVGYTPDFDDMGGADSVQDFICSNPFQVVGDGLCDIQGMHSIQTFFNDARIPEPSTVALAGLGLLMIGAGRRRLGARS